MKNLLKIILIGIVAAVTYKYLNEQDIKVGQYLQNIKPKLENLVEKAESIFSNIKRQNQKQTYSTDPEQEVTAKEIFPETKENYTPSPSPSREAVTRESKEPATTERNTVNASISLSIGKSSSPVKTKEQSVKKKRITKHPGDRYAWIKEATARYAPNAWYLLMDYDQLPQHLSVNDIDDGVVFGDKPADAFHFLSGDTKLKEISRMGINVHEIAHARASYIPKQHYKEREMRYDFHSATVCLYVNKDEEYLVSFPRKKLFPARKLASVISPRHHTFRYDSYIEGNNSTQTSGILGLLDEFHAYYLDSEFIMDIYPAYLEASETRTDALINWTIDSQSGMEAYYEFSYFIFEYLLYMKNHYPENYQELMQNNQFRKAFKRINNLFVDLVINYLKKIEQEAELITQAGKYDVSFSGEVLKISIPNGGNSSTLTVMDGARPKLDGILRSNRYGVIKAAVKYGLD